VIGRHDSIKRAVFRPGRGRYDRTGDPEQFLRGPSQESVAFRDRTVLELSPAQVSKLTVQRDGETYVLEAPGTTGKSLPLAVVGAHARPPLTTSTGDEWLTSAASAISSRRRGLCLGQLARSIGDGRDMPPGGTDATASAATYRSSGASRT